MPFSILWPTFALVVLIYVVWFVMYVQRVALMKRQPPTQEDFATMDAGRRYLAPVEMPAANLINLFEMPVLFYALVLYLFVNQRVDFAYLFAAWVFVAFRVLHSAVHCIFNLVMLRFYLYLVSALAVWFIAVRAALSQFGLI